MKHKIINDRIVQLENGAYRIADARVSLDSVVFAHNGGASPTEIKEMFPVLTHAQIRGAVQFYLENQTQIDEYLKQAEIEFELRAAAHKKRERAERPEFYERLERARRQLLEKNKF